MSAQLAALRAYGAGAAAGAPRPNVAPAPPAPLPNGAASSVAASNLAASNVVVVASGKGGVGTSTVAALLALAAAGLGQRVLLVDPDDQVGPLAQLLGVRPRHALADLRDGVDAAELVVPVSELLALVPGGPPAEASRAVEGAERRALLRRVGGLYGSHDLIVIDGGSRFELVGACCDGAAGVAGGAPARLVAVTGTDPIALAATYALVKATAQRPGIGSTELLVNRADGETAARTFALADEAARQFLGRSLVLAGSLPDDACLDLALRAGMTLLDAAAGSPAAAAAHELATRLLAPAGGPGSRARVPAAPYRVMR